MTGFNAAVSRTAIGLAVNLPQFRYNDTYQFQNNLTYLRGNHVFKMGADVRRQYVKSFFFPTIRGRLVYASLNDFVNDVAGTATINKPLPGGEEVNYYRWWDQYYYVQDEWRVPADPDVEPRAAVRAAGQQHSEPDRAERGHPRGQRQQPGLRSDAGPEDRHEQLPAASGLQLVAPRARAASSGC